jgi:AcrR family transcriptional regulator
VKASAAGRLSVAEDRGFVERGARAAHTGGIRDAIMDAARDLFYEQGIAAASVREIAARADVSLSSVYAYFEGKEQLIDAVMIRSFDVVNAEVEAAFASGGATFGTLCAAFRAHATQHMLVVKEAMLSNVGGGQAAGPPRREWRRLRKGYEERFQLLARQVADDGEIASSNLRVKIRILLTAGIDIGRWFKEGGTLSADQVADVYVDLCRTALRQ